MLDFDVEEVENLTVRKSRKSQNSWSVRLSENVDFGRDIIAV